MFDQGDQGVVWHRNVKTVIDAKQNCRLFNHVMPCLARLYGACRYTKKDRSVWHMDSQCLSNIAQGTML